MKILFIVWLVWIYSKIDANQFREEIMELIANETFSDENDIVVLNVTDALKYWIEYSELNYGLAIEIQNVNGKN